MSTMDKKNIGFELTDSAPETEQLLLERLKSSTNADDYFRWLLFIVGFYRCVNKIEAATELLKGFVKESRNADQSAHCCLALGQIATDEQRYEAALDHFTSALNLAPTKRKVIYVLHNNIGYCLNSLGRFVEGETHCRLAIEVDWTRASGYRNLGISMLGQKNIMGAAWALAEAVKAESGDNRARILLEKLLALHPSLPVHCPWIVQVLSNPEKQAEALLI
ncbi:MAG TPA: hypothetical protein VIE90_16635 [Candidatus Binatia bacterium]|jgi:Flp pilus assembly protein TadD